MPNPITVASLAERLDASIKKMDESVKKFNHHIETCEKSNEKRAIAETALAADVKKIADKMADFEAIPGRTLRWLGGLVIASAVSIILTNAWMHVTTAESAAKALTAANQTTQAVLSIPDKTADKTIEKLKAQ